MKIAWLVAGALGIAGTTLMVLDLGGVYRQWAWVVCLGVAVALAGAVRTRRLEIGIGLVICALGAALLVTT